MTTSTTKEEDTTAGGPGGGGQEAAALLPSSNLSPQTGSSLNLVDDDGGGSDVVSYVYVGNALYGTETPLPSSAVDLDSEVLRTFNGPPGKAACMDALHLLSDDMISAMKDVGAGIGGPEPGVVVNDDGPTINEGGGGGERTASLVFAYLLATAFPSTSADACVCANQEDGINRY